MRALTVLFAIVALGSAMAQTKKSLQLKDLPGAVQKTVGANLNGGEIKNIAKEKEDGVEQYEVESVLKGKSRDFNGSLGIIETFTKTGLPMMYEASYTDKNGKKHEVLVKADGSQTKE
jgi:hypothetical protein